MPSHKNSLQTVIGGLLGLLFFLLFLGFSPLNPSNIGWLLSGDASTSLLGWLFFRSEPWQFPLGSIHRYVYPIGTHVLQSDSVPGLAVLAKLFGTWLPVPFQYHGYWLLLCHVLQGVIGLKIFSLLIKEWSGRIVATLFLLSCPVLLYRGGHAALSAHWAVLLYILMILRLSRDIAEGAAFTFPWVCCLLLSVFLTGVHPYLVAMSGVLTLSLYVGAFLGFVNTRPSWGWFALRFALTLAATGASGALLGYLQVGEPTAVDWGYFSTDLLGPIHGMDRSSILPHIRTKGGIPEGFCYLGLGGMLLALYAIYVRREKKGLLSQVLRGVLYKPLFLGIIVLGFYALSPKVKFGGNTIINLEWLYWIISPLPSIFRATGRFIWPLYYTSIVLLVVAVWRTQPLRRACAILVVAIVLQWADMGRWYLDQGGRVGDRNWRLKDPLWKSIQSKVDRIYLVPPRIPSEFYAWEKLDGFDYDTFIKLATYAAFNGMAINSGLVARAPSARVRQYCSEFLGDIRRGALERRALYVVHSNYRGRFPADFFGASCSLADGLWVCLKDD